MLHTIPPPPPSSQQPLELAARVIRSSGVEPGGELMGVEPDGEFGMGDFDCDTVVDLTDFAAWDHCMTGPDKGPFPTGCEAFDFNSDADVDLNDYTAILRVLSGP